MAARRSPRRIAVLVAASLASPRATVLVAASIVAAVAVRSLAWRLRLALPVDPPESG